VQLRAFVLLLGASVVACSPSGSKSAAPGAGSSHVRDVAGIMSPATEHQIDVDLARLEAATSDQVAVVTVATLNGQPIERFSLDYANLWGLGREDLDNGVLVLVAPKQHQVRIEVGTGLEGLLTDQRAAGIIRQMIVPFRANDFDRGIALGVGRIDELLMADRKRPQPRPLAVRNAA